MYDIVYVVVVEQLIKYRFNFHRVGKCIVCALRCRRHFDFQVGKRWHENVGKKRYNILIKLSLILAT